ncbi:MAG: hypothetical protein PVF58_15270 [Candidatus Methanofastidiosia archaeon]|jgi:hypothetical protein
MISKKQKRIAICVSFNVLLEFWVHGVSGFLNFVLVISLILMYVSLFIMIEDLIVRYKLKDYHVLLLAFSYGLFQETFNTGSVFNNPQIFGVNVFNIIMVNVLWWGIIQCLYSRYFAVQIVGESKKESKTSIYGWIFAIGFNMLLFLGSVFESHLPEGTSSGYIISIGLIISGLVAFFVLKTPSEKPIRKLKVIDTLIKINLFLCVFMGVLHGFIGVGVIYFFVVWTFFLGLVYCFLRIKGMVFIG